MDIANIIDRLEALVETSKRMPGTKARMVEEDKLLKLVEQLRLAIPQDMRAAQEVIEKKDSILAQAQIEARKIRNEAEDDYAAKLDQNELLLTARRQSDDLLAEAEQKASRMVDHAEIESRRTRADSDAYVIESLKNLERRSDPDSGVRQERNRQPFQCSPTYDPPPPVLRGIIIQRHSKPPRNRFAGRLSFTRTRRGNGPTPQWCIMALNLGHDS